jgi:misacylated tRNA(Ala) deacylase
MVGSNAPAAAACRLPEGLSVARVIQIEGVDVNPCCGTHVRNLAELQLIKFTGACVRPGRSRVIVLSRQLGLEKKKGGVRVTFLAGGRALAALGTYVAREQALVRCPRFFSFPHR